MSVNFMLLMVYFKTGSLVAMFWMAVASFLKFAMIAYIWLWFLSRVSPKDSAENIANALGASLGFLQNRHWLIQVFSLSVWVHWLGFSGCGFWLVGDTASDQQGVTFDVASPLYFNQRLARSLLSHHPPNDQSSHP
jgi:hypothetical protein